MDLDPDALSLTDIIRLQTRLSESLKRRFERPLALLFTDIANSTAYFARFGDQAGRQLQQRHFDLLATSVQTGGGRIVDCAGDGAFSCFNTIDSAAAAVSALGGAVRAQNETFGREHPLALRASVHWGFVLTDGVVVTGDAVNLAARVVATCQPGETRLTDSAFRGLSKEYRLRCRALPAVYLKGISEPVSVVALDLHGRVSHPRTVLILESSVVVPIPEKETISFGRLADHGSVPGNDVVLTLPDRAQIQAVSRWHFELLRGVDGFTLRSLTAQSTIVDGRSIGKGEDAPIRGGSRVSVGGVLTLEFRDEMLHDAHAEETLTR